MQNETINDNDNDSKKKCYLNAIKLLTKKNYSQFQLKNKLLQKKYSEEIVNELIPLLVNKNFLREDLYKEARIKSLLLRSYHPSYIEQKMEEEQCPVTEDEIEHVLFDLKIDSNSILYDLIYKKIKIMTALNTTKEKMHTKILRLTISKGFSFEDSNLILNNLMDKND